MYDNTNVLTDDMMEAAEVWIGTDSTLCSASFVLDVADDIYKASFDFNWADCGVSPVWSDVDGTVTYTADVTASPATRTVQVQYYLYITT